MLKNILHFIPFIFLVGCDPQEKESSLPLNETYQFDPSEVTALTIASDESKISITKDPSIDKIKLRIKDLHLIPEVCDISVKLDHKTIKFKNKRNIEKNKLERCAVSFDVVSPIDIKDTKINLGSGIVIVNDIKTRLNVNAGSVDVITFAPLSSIKVNAGNILADITGVQGESKFSFGSAKIDLKYDTLKKVRHIVLNGGFVDSTITLPKNKKVNFNRVSASSGVQVINRTAKKQSNPDLDIKLNVGSGQVEFKEV